MRLLAILSILVSPVVSLAGSLPAISTQPQNLTNSGTFLVVAANASSYQWRCNGVDIAGATNASLVRSASDPAGYYMVVAKNDTGWVPSRLAYLTRGSGGYVPFSNYGNTAYLARACYDYALGMVQVGQPLTNGLAEVVAGPEVDQMAPIGYEWDFSWYSDDPSWAGYFDYGSVLVPSVSPGQTVYYQVNLSYPTGSGPYTQPSRTLALIAGGGAYPVPSASDLKFPIWLEWPEPRWGVTYPGTNLAVASGETITITSWYGSCPDLGRPVTQWRKDGLPLPGMTNVLATGPYCGSASVALVLTNVQAADAGVYDVVVRGGLFICEPKITLSVQISGAGGVLQSPRTSGMNFFCDLAGMVGRRYDIQWSTDLINWNVDQTVSNATGVVTFGSAIVPDAPRFYRSRLLPP